MKLSAKLDDKPVEKSGIEQEPSVERPFSKPQHFWFVEAWYQARPSFIDIIAHLLNYSLLFGSFYGIHILIEVSTLPPGLKSVLLGIDFASVVVAFIIFSVKFNLKLIGFQKKSK